MDRSNEVIVVGHRMFKAPLSDPTTYLIVDVIPHLSIDSRIYKSEPKQSTPHSCSPLHRIMSVATRLSHSDHLSLQ